MKKFLLLLAFLFFAAPALALPGFIVSKDETPVVVPDTTIILSAHEGHQVMTIMPTIASSQQDLLLVIPVPSTLTRDHIRMLDARAFDALDALSAPRLEVETDANPCTGSVDSASRNIVSSAARYAVQDATMDSTVLSAQDAATLPAWLRKKGYILPPKAEQIFLPTLKTGWTVALITLHRSETKRGYLPPIQLSYDAPNIGLPLRLGLINAPKPVVAAPKAKEIHILNSAPDAREPDRLDVLNDDGQSITLYVLTQRGTVSSPTMRSVPLVNTRNDVVLPLSAKDDFATIAHRIRDVRAKAENNAMIIDYAGRADVPDAVLQSVGVTWLNDAPAILANTPLNDNLIGGMLLPKAAYPKAVPLVPDNDVKTKLTRMTLRVSPSSLPHNIELQEDETMKRIVAIYHAQRPWTQDTDLKKTCDGAALYQRSVATREAHAMQTLGRLTGWIADHLNSQK